MLFVCSICSDLSTACLLHRIPILVGHTHWGAICQGLYRQRSPRDVQIRSDRKKITVLSQRFSAYLIESLSIAIFQALDYGEPPQNTSTEVTIKIRDVNDERPRFYTDPYLAHVPENLEPGHKVTQIAAFDPDLGENGQVFYKLGEGHDNKFYIDGKGK